MDRRTVVKYHTDRKPCDIMIFWLTVSNSGTIPIGWSDTFKWYLKVTHSLPVICAHHFKASTKALCKHSCTFPPTFFSIIHMQLLKCGDLMNKVQKSIFLFWNVRWRLDFLKKRSHCLFSASLSWNRAKWEKYSWKEFKRRGQTLVSPSQKVMRMTEHSLPRILHLKAVWEEDFWSHSAGR